MRGILVSLLAVVALVPGCGYNTTGRSSGSVGDVYLPFFEDLTTGERADNLGPRLTDLLLAEFLQDKDVRVYQAENERDLADKELLGTVQRLTETVITRDAVETGEESRVVILCSITYNDLGTGKTLWQDSRVLGDGNYFIDQGQAGFEAAVEEALDEIVQAVLDKTVRAW